MIRVGGVGGVTPLGPEGSALVVAPPTYTNHYVEEGPCGAPALSTSANTHTLRVEQCAWVPIR